MHGMKIQVCQQGELDSHLCRGGLILWPATLGSPAFLLWVGVASGRHPWELWDMEVNAEMVFLQLPPCWYTVRSCSLPLPTSLHQPWHTALILAFPKPCPHQNPLQRTQFLVCLWFPALYALNDLTSASFSSFTLLNSLSLTSSQATWDFSPVLKCSKPVPISGPLSLPQLSPPPYPTPSHLHGWLPPYLSGGKHSLLTPSIPPNL